MSGYGRKIGSRNQPKTRVTCHQGHSLTDPANTVVRVSCLTCRRESMRRFRDKPRVKKDLPR